MAVEETKVVSITRDRVCRIIIEKPFGGIPSLMTVHEDIIDGVPTLISNMSSVFDPENPLDVALEAALRAKVDAMRESRDTITAATKGE